MAKGKIPPKKGRPRLENVSKSFEAQKPWIALKMSRSTWYRRRSEKAKAKTMDERRSRARFADQFDEG
jgi:hypothetical protein